MRGDKPGKKQSSGSINANANEFAPEQSYQNIYANALESLENGEHYSFDAGRCEVNVNQNKDPGRSRRDTSLEGDTGKFMENTGEQGIIVANAPVAVMAG